MVALVVPALMCCTANLAAAASIGTPSYAAASSPTVLTNVGSSDWELYGKQGGPTQTPSESKSGGTSIKMLTPVITSPTTADNSGISRSSATFSWSGGTPDASGASVDPYDNGFNFFSTSTANYYDSYETMTFVPGDTNLHTVHLYGYLSGNDLTGITGFQFSNSLAGASSVVSTFTSSLGGNWDYSVSFQADNPNDVFTVVWTFQKTGNNGIAKRMGIQAAAIDGQSAGTNWRVIANDTNYPTRDVIVAGVVIGDAVGGATLPADSTNNDCSAYFQAALNLMSSAGGGTVFVPAGIYCFSNSLTVPGGVTLRGRWVPPGPTQPVTGTIFKIYAGQGDTNAAPFISQGGNGGGLQGLAFWYPNQWATNWQYYPYTIRGNVQEADELTLVNSYQGIYIPTASFTYLTDIYGTPLTTGFFMDNGPAFPRFYRIKFAPDYWRWSGLPGSPTNVMDWAALTMNMLANTNSVAVDIRSPDGGNLEGCVISGYCYGIRNANSLNANPPSGHIDYHNNVVTNCTEAHRVDYTVGINCYNCIFGGTTNGIAYHYVSGRGDSFYGCTLQGGSYAVLDNANSGRLHTLSFQNCTLSGQASINNYATLAMIGSSFTTAGSNLILNSGVRGVTIIGGTNCGPASIVNNSGLNTSDPTVYFVSTKPTQPEPVLLIPYPNVNHPGWRRPLQSRLFNVVNYGAKGDGVTDDTAAIRAAITAAHTNGGGIVFFPAAFYLVSQPLSVTNGVELRGIYGLLNSAVNVGSTLVINTGANNTNAPPFITLGDYCGIRGINVQYANQTWSNGVYIPYPYTIQCGGVSNYVWNCVLGNSYQGVDFKGARNGVADGCCMSGLVNAYKFEGGTTNCLVQFGGVKPLGYWPGPGAANGDGNFNSISKTAVSYILADCTNVTVNAIFTHCAYALASVQGGDQLNLLEITGERLQNGMLFESGGANVLMQDSAPSHVNCTQGTGAYDFWLKTNFSGTVTALGAHGTYENENYTLLMDSTNATFAGYNIDLGGGNPLQAMKVAGTAAIYGGNVGGCTLEVPAGGKFTVVDSTLGRMPYVPQAGLMDWSTNCQPDAASSFVAANLNNPMPIANGISVNVSNLVPTTVNADASGRSSKGDVIVGWHLANSGVGTGTLSNNFNFHVTGQYFTNGLNGFWPSVTLEVYYLEDTDGSLAVYYDSTNGMKLGATYTLVATNAQWDDQSFTVNDARFVATNGVEIMLVASNCDPVVEYVAINSTSYLGVPPQFNPPPPVAGFTRIPASGIRPLPVTFTDTSTGAITNLLWSFGDSQTTNTPAGAMVLHTYPTEGTYTVTLKASGPGGSGTNTQTGSVTVLIPNPPVITTIRPVGTTALMLQGIGGPTNGGYYYWLRSSTNLALPLTNWNIVATNPFDIYGNFSNQIPLTPGSSQQFYRMHIP